MRNRTITPLAGRLVMGGLRIKEVGTIGEPTKLPGAKGGSMQPGLKLIATSDGRGLPHATAKRASPARSPRLSLVVVGGREHRYATDP